MGTGLTVECSNCGYGKTFHLGVGMMYGSLENVFFLVPRHRRESVLGILRNHEVQDAEYEHKLFACPGCNTLQERFHYRVLYDDGKTLEPSFRCGKCRSRLEPARKDVSKYSCPECGDRSLRGHEGIHWD